jgi:threonine/homoserine/homoserine lactone efflux protein
VALLRELPAFFAAVLLISAAPGPAVALLVRRAATRGFEATVPVVVGLELGLYFWIVAAGAGLAALVAASDTAYLVLRIGGGAFLVLLGLRAWREAVRGGAEAAAPPDGSRRSGFLLGVVTNLANPKAAVFTFAFYPQFIPHGYDLLPTAALLGVLQISFELCLYCAFVAGVARTRGWFLRRRTRRILDALSGSALLGLGARVAAESR